MIDNTTPGLIVPPNFVPSWEAHLVLPAKGVVKIPFDVSLSGVNSNEVCIFHLIQLRDDIVQGGLTLVVVRL